MAAGGRMVNDLRAACGATGQLYIRGADRFVHLMTVFSSEDQRHYASHPCLHCALKLVEICDAYLG